MTDPHIKQWERLSAENLKLAGDNKNSPYYYRYLSCQRLIAQADKTHL